MKAKRIWKRENIHLMISDSRGADVGKLKRSIIHSIMKIRKRM